MEDEPKARPEHPSGIEDDTLLTKNQPPLTTYEELLRRLIKSEVRNEFLEKDLQALREDFRELRNSSLSTNQYWLGVSLITTVVLALVGIHINR